MTRGLAFALALAIGAVNLAPVWLLAKQAITPERESFAWPLSSSVSVSSMSSTVSTRCASPAIATP